MKKGSLLILIISCLFSQADINFSLETRYGNGLQITSLGSFTPDTSAYRYFENLLDINSIYRNDLYVYLQLEYSDPPIFGFSLDGVNAFYLEYTQERMRLKAGDLYTIYGRGVSLRTFQDQNIDYDNSLKGIELTYDLSDRIRLFSLLGQGMFYYRGNPAVIVPDRSLKNKVILIGSEYYSDHLGDFTFFYFSEDKELSQDVILSYEAEIFDTRLARELFTRISFDDVGADTVRYTNRTLTWNKSTGWVDIYLEKAWNNYTKILGDRIRGSMFYAALSMDVFNTWISYEYKNYNMPFLIQSVSNPPTLAREATSVLVSRNAHAINAGEERGHQTELNREIFTDTHLIANLSFSRRQQGFHTAEYESFNINQSGNAFSGYWQTDSSLALTTKKPSLAEILKFSDGEGTLSHYPYRQFYLELSGWQMNDMAYYRIGADQYDEITVYHDQIDYIPTNPMTDDDLLNYFLEYYSNHYWEIWNQNYYPDLGLDSTYANSVFEISYGAPIADIINEDTQNAFQTVSPQLNSLPQPEKNYEKISAFTIPAQFAFHVDRVGAFTIYVERQWKTIEINKDKIFSNGETDNSLSQKETYDLNYFSMSYEHPLNFSLTLFYETEGYRKKLGNLLWSDGDHHWTGFDFTYDLNENSQLSFFVGSQKGGRVCANGICADQPGFEDGIKVTFRSIF